jgi:hypothetical protein
MKEDDNRFGAATTCGYPDESVKLPLWSTLNCMVTLMYTVSPGEITTGTLVALTVLPEPVTVERSKNACGVCARATNDTAEKTIRVKASRAVRRPEFRPLRIIE